MKKGIVNIAMLLTGISIGFAAALQLKKNGDENVERRVGKFRSYYYLLNEWIKTKQAGGKIEDYFLKNNYKKIAIYGMGEIGRRLLSELEGSEVKVEYAIDKNASNQYGDIQIVNPSDELQQVDVIVVTSVFDYETVKEELQVEYPVISMEEIVY